MEYNEGIDRAIDMLGDCFLVMWAYTWARILLSIRIENNKKAFSVIGKLVSGLFTLLGSIITALILGFMFKSFSVGVTSFVVVFIAAIIALFSCYNEYKKSID